MNNTVSTMDTTTFDFELIKADFQDLVNYINNNKENLDLDKLKELRENLSQLETILTNAIGDKPKAEKKAAKKATAKKTTKKAKVETFDEVEGKVFYNKLNVGDTFQYVMANGTIITAKKIETKSKSGLSAACEVISGLEIAEGKTAKRYPKFNKLLKAQNTERVEKVQQIVEIEKPIEQAKTAAKAASVEKPIEQEPVQMAASVETENDLFGDDFDFDIE